MIILFDLDGTLIDSTDAILESFHHTFDFYKVAHPSDEGIKKLIGYPLDIMFIDFGVAKEKVWEYVATYKEHYRKISIPKTYLIASAKEAIIKASQFATLGIVTTKTGMYSRMLMEHFGLMEYFEVLVGHEDVQNPKPHPEPILKALKNLDVQGREVWMIGDTKLDMIAAQSAGVSCMGVLSGYDPREVIELYTNHIFQNVLEAVVYLQDRNISHR